MSLHRTFPHTCPALSPLQNPQDLVQRCPPRRLPLFPQLFWTSLVLLRTASTALYARTVRLLLLVLRKLDVRDGGTQAVLLAAAPSGAAAAEAGEEAGQVRGLEALLMPLLYGGGTSGVPHDAPTTGADHLGVGGGGYSDRFCLHNGLDKNCLNRLCLDR